jgi:hypothetical protein
VWPAASDMAKFFSLTITVKPAERIDGEQGGWIDKITDDAVKICQGEHSTYYYRLYIIIVHHIRSLLRARYKRIKRMEVVNEIINTKSNKKY